MYIDDITWFSKRHAAAIKNNFRPLLGLGISNAVMYRIKNDGEFSLIALDIESQEKYWGSNIYKSSKVLISPSTMSDGSYAFSAWQLYDNKDQKSLMLNHFNQFKINSALNLVKKINNCVYGYSFRSMDKNFDAAKMSSLINCYIKKKSSYLETCFNQCQTVNLSDSYLLGKQFYNPSEIFEGPGKIQPSGDFTNLLLSERELCLIKMFNEDLSCKEISYHMNLSSRTIQNYVVRLKNKFGLKDIYDLRKHIKMSTIG